MNKQIITFDANEQSLIKTGGVDKYSSNKVSYIEAHFNLGENWSGYDSVRAVWSTWYECISTVLDTEGICIVPYEVLKRTDKVMVNLVGSISEDDVLTDRITTYPIKALEVDADAKVCGSNTQPITPSEYEQFVEAVKADADRAEEAKEDARGFASSAEISAQNASISETNASTSEDNAKVSELNAETYKNQAQTHAQNANNSAISAENAKDEAEDARDTILGMRAEATTLPEGSSATASYNDGVMSFGIPKGDTGATGATGETGATPQLSIGTVETTTEPSVTITGTAENPVLNFGLVKGDKGDTGEVSLADLSTLLPTDTASGSIASFPDGQSVIPALSVVADIEPIQDLHGYDKPWSGGNGKNKLEISVTHYSANGCVISQEGDAIKIVANNATGYPFTKVGVLSSSFPSGSYYLKSTPTVTGMGFRIIDRTVTPVKEIPVNWDGAVTIPSGHNELLVEVAVTASQITNGTYTLKCGLMTENIDYQPYSNICPISGHDEVNVSVCGVNVWDEEFVAWARLETYANNSGSKNYIPVRPDTTYHITVGDYSISSNGLRLAYYDVNKNLIKSLVSYAGSGDFTTPSDCAYMKFGLQSQVYGSTYKNDISINYPSTDTSYHAYNGTTYEVSFGTAGTVYGGTLDVVSGVLTVKYGIVTVDGVTVTVRNNGQTAYSTRAFFTPSPAKANGTSNMISDKFARFTGTDTSGVVNGRAGLGGVEFFLPPTVADTSAAVNAWFASNNTQLCYELATPTTVQLTAQEVELLVGQNNIWADTGDVEVTYKADVTKWVEKQLS